MNQCDTCPMELIETKNKNLSIYVCKTCGTIVRYTNIVRTVIKADGEVFKQVIENK